ncbi:MAG: glutamyl-tRNA reductase [Gammaproteobacteria bacterium]|nr:glutamyl-tRNA reductase [Gammaproteobacteria bacterium]
MSTSTKSLHVLGINHRTAPVAIREEVAFDPEQQTETLTELKRFPGVNGAVILSTCNRTEIYCDVDTKQADKLADWLAEHRGLSATAREALYVLDGAAAISHAFEVACGLDSMVLGEPQILGQVKKAHADAIASGAADSLLNLLFQRVFAVAKQVRTDTMIGASQVSIASAAISLAREIYSRFDRLTALLVGAGDTTRLTAKHLRSNGLGRMIIANRSVERARGVALEFGAFAISLGEIPTHLAEADIVITSTASPTPLIQLDMVEMALRSRKRRPIFMADLAVPRDIEPAIAELEDVYLYSLDDLHELITRNQQAREHAAVDARQIIDEATQQFQRIASARDAAPLIRSLRQSVEGMRNQTIEDARRMLQSGRDPAEVVDYVANTLTSRLLHAPSTRLRMAGEQADVGLTQAAAELFGIEQPTDTDTKDDSD